MANIHDGVGERLINIDTAFLNDPAYKTAGWSANPAELKRTYSPPIPTTISSEYFKAPSQFASRATSDPETDEDEGGMVTGVGNNEALGPTFNARRRRWKEQLEEDDSSDLSDESDDDYDESQRPANQIRFARMPSRGRAGSSPLRKQDRGEGPSVLVTAPSKPPSHPLLERGSLGAVEAMKKRARRDTTTSSEVSSDNDLDPAVFRRRQIQASPGARARSATLTDHIEEDDEDDPALHPDPETDRHDNEEVESDTDESSLASDFSVTGDPGSLLGGSPDELESSSNFRSSSAPGPVIRPFRQPENEQNQSDELPELPSPRPVSTLVHYSVLSAALRESEKKPAGPFERFSTLSGGGEQNPLYIKIYLPPEVQATAPLELLLRRTDPRGGPVTVAEAIGFALWRYGDEGMKPPIPPTRFNVNWWTLRIVEDEEVDFDFPPLSRGRPILDFTSNNNRPPRMRARDKPWDEFALVEATPAQFAENEKVTPLYSTEAAAVPEEEPKPSKPDRVVVPHQQLNPITSRAAVPRRNPVTDPRFTSLAARKDSATLDNPSTTVSHAVPRTGAPKTLNVHFVDHTMNRSTVAIACTTDTYIAEVHDQACKRLNVDKALYVLKVTNTATVAPADRTVEALGAERQSLDLVRRRFVGDGTFGISGSPGSTSPNAPLMLTTPGTSKRPPKPKHPLAQQPDVVGPALSGLNSNFRRYNVLRKQPMSFAPSHQRVLALDGEYMHVMPSDTAKERLWDANTGKTTSIHFSSVVGCKVNRKHPKTFRVVVFKERESKRYDFEASTAAEAAEIVEELRRGIAPYREAVAL